MSSITKDFLPVSLRIEGSGFAVELSRNLPAVLCFHGFATIRTCTHPHFSNKSP